ncbi:MAG: pectin esterase [Bacteroidales bacterium]|nr:pectin esterase [Bacteroidales bacterium]
MMKTIRLFVLSLLCLAMSLPVNAQEQTAEKKYDIVVARDGSGDFRNIQDAIESIRAFKPGKRTTVFIKKGVYKEKVTVHTWITNVDFIGESRENTIITYDDHANICIPGTAMKMGTFRTHTLYVQGNDITFQNLTIENNAEQKGQAVALHVEGDRVAFFNCNILGNQDTIYTGREQTRNYFENCYINGTTDYIFGPSTVWFEACQLHCKRDSYITAASTPEYVKYGYIFNNCKITAEARVSKMYLGRPWRQYGMTLFMHCDMGGFIRPEGWHNWGKTENEQCARYYEFENTGEGAASDKRVFWSKQLSKKEAKEYTLENVMGDWNPQACKIVM